MTIRKDSWRNLSRRDEEMLKFNGTSLNEIGEKHKTHKGSRERNMGKTLRLESLYSRTWKSRSEWDWNRTDETSPFLFSPLLSPSVMTSGLSVHQSRLTSWELLVLWGSLLLTSSSLLRMAFPSSATLSLVPSLLWCHLLLPTPWSPMSLQTDPTAPAKD